MVSRVVLGCGSVGRALVSALQERRGDLVVLSDDSHRVETLRNENVAAEPADVTDPASVRAKATAADTVVVAGDDPTRNRRAATVAREVFPDAFLLAYTGVDPTDDDRRALAETADRTVDRAAATAAALGDRVGERGLRARRLCRVFRSLAEPLAVVTHDNPDPDAIASAVALGAVAERAGCATEVCYYGHISHRENRAMVNLLEFDLTNLDPDAELDRFGSFALVDHSRPGVNDGLPEDTPVDIVVDHHPPRAPVDGRFVDLRSDVGATSTLVTDYLRTLGLDPDTEVATGLLFGIRVDTDDFTREVSVDDFEAAAHLLPHADAGALDRIESPSVSGDTLDVIARAVTEREVSDGVLTSCVGAIHDRDALAQAADRLLGIEGVGTTLVYGYTDDTVYPSARARGADLDLGEVLREAFGRIGSAGGHADMAGAQIPIGMLAEPDEEDTDEELRRAVRDVVTDRFFGATGAGPDTAATAVYTGDDFFGTDFGEDGGDG